MSDPFNPGLSFTSLNPEGQKTLLLLHGTFASHHAFQLLSKPHLSNYHLLIPDLPCHGLSTNLGVSFTLPIASALVADLISTEAKNGKADIVGDDIGGYIALYLASKHPNLVSSVFATGCERDYSSFFYSTWMAIKIYLGAVLGMVLMPRCWLLPVTKKLDMEFNDSLLADMESTISWSYSWNLFRTLRRDWGNGKKICENIMVRTLMIAAGRQDIVEGARERGVWLRKGGNAQSKAVVVQGARHAWACQVGKVDSMSRGIRAWVENEDLPIEYVVLEDVN